MNRQPVENESEAGGDATQRDADLDDEIRAHFDDGGSRSDRARRIAAATPRRQRGASSATSAT